MYLFLISLRPNILILRLGLRHYTIVLHSKELGDIVDGDDAVADPITKTQQSPHGLGREAVAVVIKQISTTAEYPLDVC